MFDGSTRDQNLYQGSDDRGLASTDQSVEGDQQQNHVSGQTESAQNGRKEVEVGTGDNKNVQKASASEDVSLSLIVDSDSADHGLGQSPLIVLWSEGRAAYLRFVSCITNCGVQF